MRKFSLDFNDEVVHINFEDFNVEEILEITSALKIKELISQNSSYHNVGNDNIICSQKSNNVLGLPEEIGEDEDLDLFAIKQKLPRTSKNFRCKNCNQSTFMISELEEKLLFRLNSHTLYSLRYTTEPSFDIKTEEGYKDFMQLYREIRYADKVNFDQTVLVEDDDINVYKCPYCGQIHTAAELLKYYDYPENIYEDIEDEDVTPENICEICGCLGEPTINNKEPNSYVKCKNLCYEKIQWMGDSND